MRNPFKRPGSTAPAPAGGVQPRSTDGKFSQWNRPKATGATLVESEAAPAMSHHIGDGYVSPTLPEAVRFYIYRVNHAGRGEEFAGPFGSVEEAQEQSSTIDRKPTSVNPRPSLYVVCEAENGWRYPYNG